MYPLPHMKYASMRHGTCYSLYAILHGFLCSAEEEMEKDEENFCFLLLLLLLLCRTEEASSSSFASLHLNILPLTLLLD
jgi:hypothetical protein